MNKQQNKIVDDGVGDVSGSLPPDVQNESSDTVAVVRRGVPAGIPGVGGSLGQCGYCGKSFFIEIMSRNEECKKKMLALRDGDGRFPLEAWKSLPPESPLIDELKRLHEEYLSEQRAHRG